MTTPAEPPASTPDERAGCSMAENPHVAPHEPGPAGTGADTDRGGDPAAEPAADTAVPGGESA